MCDAAMCSSFTVSHAITTCQSDAHASDAVENDDRRRCLHTGHPGQSGAVWFAVPTDAVDGADHHHSDAGAPDPNADRGRFALIPGQSGTRCVGSDFTETDRRRFVGCAQIRFISHSGIDHARTAFKQSRTVCRQWVCAWLLRSSPLVG